MKKYFLSVILLLIAFGVQPAQAYNPPPAMNIWALLAPRVTIKLPPLLVAVPDKLRFDGVDYTFINGQFLGQQHLGHKISTRVTGAGAGQYYIISITGWKIDTPALIDWKMTFKTPVTKLNIKALENYLNTPGYYADTASLSGLGCVGGTSHICLKTITSVRAYGLSLPNAYLFQTLPTKGIFVEGNTAASGTLENFILSPKALAVGGAISIQGGGKLLAPYNINVTPIGWLTAGQIITSQFDKRTAGSQLSFRNFTGDWNLNSSTGEPINNNSDSFSTPPEGKLWNVDISGNTLTLGTPLSATSFKGSGTIAIDGNLVINGDITCQSSTRLGFLVRGNITVNPSNKAINCGAFVALGDTGITLNVPQPSKQGTYKVIYISAKDIKLPDPSNLTGPYTINYDSYFAKNPTALFSEILSIVFGS